MRTLFVNAKRISSEEGRAIAEDVEKSRRDPNKSKKAKDIADQKAGCHGVPCLHKILPYLDYHDAFLVPVWHCLLYGVVKNFVTYLLNLDPKLPPSHLSPDAILHAKRAVSIINCTSDGGRNYECVVKYR